MTWLNLYGGTKFLFSKSSSDLPKAIRANVRRRGRPRRECLLVVFCLRDRYSPFFLPLLRKGTDEEPTEDERFAGRERRDKTHRKGYDGWGPPVDLTP